MNEGEFRDYNSEENKAFMKELNEGYVPKELMKTVKGPVAVALKDKRKEVYTPPPPPKYVAYSGSG